MPDTYQTQPGASFTAVIGGMPSETGAFSPSYPPPDVAVGVQIVPLAGGAPVVARSLAQQQLPHSAIYAKQLTAPNATGDYTVLWDYNGGNPPFFSQTLSIDTSIPVAPTSGSRLSPVYVQIGPSADPNEITLLSYPGFGDLVIDDAGQMNRLIVECELEIDSILGFWIRDPTTGRKVSMSNIIPVAPISPFPGELFAPYQRGITIYQKAALQMAVCAQVEYHLEKGEAFFRTKQRAGSVSGPQFSRTNTEAEPYIAPKVNLHLAGTGLVRRVARAII